MRWRAPRSYFQARRAGDSIARVRELETVRNFLTGSALTLVGALLWDVRRRKNAWRAK